MTSIAEQLKAAGLARQPHGLGGGQQGGSKVSLLYTPQEADSMDMDTVCALGSNGLSKLIGISSTFESFRALFGPAARDNNRELMTKPETQRLDERITGFLFHASPFALLPGTHQALEWLIRRFNVQHYNVDALMEFALPYHATKLFARVVQLLDFANHTRWQFLTAVKKTGAPLDRATLIKRCAADNGMLAFVCEMPGRALAQEPQPPSVSHVITFTVSVVLGSIERRVTANSVTVILPLVIRSLELERTDSKASALMIVAQLASSTTLAAATATALFELVGANAQAPLTFEAVVCLAVLCATQQFPPPDSGVVVALASLPGFASTLGEVAGEHDASALLETLAVGLLDVISGGGDSQPLTDILDRVRLSEATATRVLRRFIASYTRLYGECISQKNANAPLEAARASFGPVLAKLERSYPTVVDSVIAKQLGAAAGESTAAPLRDLVKMCLPSVRHQAVAAVAGDDTEAEHAAAAAATSLFLALEHSDAAVRLLGLGELASQVEHYQGDEVSAADKEFIASAAAARIADTSKDVAAKALAMVPLLRGVVPAEQLVTASLAALRDAAGRRGHSRVAEAAAEALVSLAEGASDADRERIMLCLMPYTLITVGTRKSSRLITKVLAASALTKSFPLLRHLDRAVSASGWRGAKHAEDVTSLATASQHCIEEYAHNVATAAAGPDLDGILQAVGRLSRQDNPCGAVLARLVLVNALTKAGKPAVERSICASLVPLLAAELGRHADEDASSPVGASLKDTSDAALLSLAVDSLSALEDQRRVRATPGQLRSAVARQLHMAHLSLSRRALSLSGSHAEAVDNLAMLHGLFTLATSASSRCLGAPLQALLRRCDEEDGSLALLRPLWLAADRGVTARTRAASLQIAAARFSAGADGDLAAEEQVELVAELIAALAFPDAAVRAAALACLRALLPGLDAAKAGVAKQVAPFVAALCQDDQALVADQSRVAVSVCGRLTGDSAVGSAKAVLQLLVSKAVTWPNAFARSLLFDALALANTNARLTGLLPTLQSTLARVGAEAMSRDEQDVLRKMLRTMTPKAASAFPGKAKGGAPAALDVLLRALQTVGACTGDGKAALGSLDSPAAWTLQDILSNRFYQGLPADVQLQVFRQVLASSQEYAGRAVGDLAHGALLSLTVASETINAELSAAASKEEPAPLPRTPASRKKRASIAAATPAVTPADLIKGLHDATALLELLLAKDTATLTSPAELLPTLFDLLSMCASLEGEDKDQVEYTKQLVMENISRLVVYSKPEDDFVNVGLVVQLLRTSENLETQKHALLLLSSIAKYRPERVLHGIMPVFTFMSAGILRQDDVFSFHIIEQTVKHVVPAVMAASPDEVAPRIRSIVEVFVDCMAHIPAHRRLALFADLLSTVGPSEYLHVFILLLLKRIVVLGQEKDLTVEALQKFCLSLQKRCSLEDQVRSMVQMADLMLAFPLTADDEITADVRAIFDASLHDAKQLRHFRYLVSRSLAGQLASVGFLRAVVEAEQGKDGQSPLLRSAFVELVRRSVALVGLYREQASGASSEHAGTARYWDQLVKTAQGLMERVNNLLTFGDYLQVATSLIAHDDDMVRRKTVEVLAERVLRQHKETGLREEWHHALLDLLAPVVAALDADASADTALLQAAVYAANVLTLTLGPTYPKAFICIASPVITLLNRTITDRAGWPVAANALACLGTVFATLGPRIMAHLQQGASATVAAVKVCLEMGDGPAGADGLGDGAEEREEAGAVAQGDVAVDGMLVQSSGLAAMHALVKHLGQFLGPHLETMMAVVTCDALCTAPSDGSGEEEGRGPAPPVSAGAANLIAKAAAIREEVATTVPTRIFLTAAFAAYRKTAGQVTAEAVAARARLLSMVTRCVSALANAAVVQQHKAIFAFLLEALDQRSLAAGSPTALDDEAVVAAVEAHEEAAAVCVKALVMKLSDSAFRPMFAKVLSWATGAATTPHRLLTLYQLVNLLADTLQRFFVPYFAGLTEGCVGLLEGGATTVCDTPADAQRLVSSVLDALRKAFLYDRSGFVNQTRYRMLMPAIVNQLAPAPGVDLATPGGEEGHISRVRSVVVPCITQLAVVAGEEKLWKPLNDAVLVHTRHPAPAVRRGALITLKALHEKLGEELLSLLTDTVPFLAELLEDDSLEVERECQALVAQIERYLGQSLSEHF